MPALYTKYRPKRFSEVVGQKAIVQTLKNAVMQGGISHAYLFTGSRGVGKTSLARIMARVLNCANQKDGEACMVCDTCKAFDSGSFLDLLEIDAASHTGVDNIRSIIEHVQFRPARGNYKVYIIDEVHMLSKGAFNALLKTLEEPPAHAVFILATTEIQKLPITIISRTQRFDFSKIADQDMVSHLAEIAKQENKTVPEDVLRLIVEHSGGALRDALTRLEKILLLDEVNLDVAQSILGVTDLRLQLELLGLIKQGNAAVLPAYFEQLLEHAFDMNAFARDVLETLRKLTIDALRGSKTIDTDLRFSVNEAIFLSKLFLKAYKDITYAPDATMPLLIAAVEGCSFFAKNNTPPIRESKVSEVTIAPALVSTPEPLAPPMPPAPVQPKAPLGKVVTEAEVRLLWSQVIDLLRKKNGPLGTLIKNSPLIEVVDNSVVIGVKYLFHKEHLESAKNLQVVADVLREVINADLAFEARVVKTESDNELVNTNTLDTALQVFGGEIIE